MFEVFNNPGPLNEFVIRPDLVPADMVYFEAPEAGAVFSVGSISWCSCLSFNGGDNNVSRVTENVLRKFANQS